METEKQVEEYLRDRIKELGGRAYKWVSPGNTGVPDRIVIINGWVLFVELKSNTGRLTANQKSQIRRLVGLQQHVGVIGSKAEVDGFLEAISEFRPYYYLERSLHEYGV